MIEWTKPRSEIGLVIDWEFHKRNGWYVALTQYLVNSIVKTFKPKIISNQKSYDRYKKRLKHIFSIELGVPKIKFDLDIQCNKYLFHSDPHFETQKRANYYKDNHIDFILSFYKSPFFKHNPNFPKTRFVHFPWAIPDQFVSNRRIVHSNTGIIAFGGKMSDAYDVRNWCRNQSDIINFDYSGVENKVLVGEKYFNWLSEFDCIIAAGSSDPKYDLVTPKYFEIASSGSLLFGQSCTDLDDLGFNSTNCLPFEKENFNSLKERYLNNPESFQEVREAGRELIKEKHCLSHRINLLRELVE
ncbi:MAG: glycosyltransferase [Cytophagales bacterium]